MTGDAHTISAYIAKSVTLRADENAFGAIQGGKLRWRTWGEISHDIEALAGGLRLAGIAPHGDHVTGQISENRYK